MDGEAPLDKLEHAGLWRPEWRAGELARRELADDACDLWRLDLERVAAAGGGDAARSPLDAAERARAARFVFERHRRWYTAAHTALRSIVGAYLGIAPSELPIEIGRLGRPRLAAAAGTRTGGGCWPLDFNLSHSDSLAVLAVSRRGPLGVDVERLRPMDDALALARRHFVGDEIAQVEAADGVRRIQAFFTCWTRKEAVLKSTGVGLSVAPASVWVGATPDPLQLAFVAPEGATPLQLRSFVVRDEALGACACVPGVRLANFFDGSDTVIATCSAR